MPVYERSVPAAPAIPAPIKFLPLLVLVFVIVIGGWTGRAIQLAARSLPAAPVIELGYISAAFTPEVQYWGQDIARWADPYGLDPNLAATVMQIESCGNPEAVSPSGAQGLFQVMPFHFAAGEAMRDPDTNAKRGLDYLSLGLETSGGAPGLALAGYNGGHSIMSALWSNWSAETQRYYYWGSGIYGEVSESRPAGRAGEGRETSDTLNEWLNAGGASLCAKAREQLRMP